MMPRFNYIGFGVVFGVAVLAFLAYRKKVPSASSDASASDSSVTASSTSTKQPLTIRSNNPGAIMGTDGNIIVYDTSEKGVEAMLKLLRSYVDRGYNTISKILLRWAPLAAGNASYSYISYVSSHSGIQQDAVIDVTNRVSYLPRIAYYMHIMEAGHAWIDESVFQRIARTLM
jgi:hypothetical protein